ncbi:DMT family transporter [Paraburkholderia sp. USG1]|uniref:DMT family transporter n=1 Tax=Paraburkholderia sp. USG1 TaxID=2952268 RepID=UPI002855E104|nr:DMT family transporter [Paraburkholderia sp. USG1]MDR8400404.1 DMT family transporter [Paraburkholderia sp. USG1]
MSKQWLVGVTAAVFAAFSWSLNFVAPYILGPYSIYDLAVCRFAISGLIGLVLLQKLRGRGSRLALHDWLVAAWLGFVGYVGYFLIIMAAVLFAGPIIPPAFVAMVPVVLSIAGNLGRQKVPWRGLCTPLMLMTLGLILVNRAGFAQALDGFSLRIGIGIGFSICAVALWTIFAVTNQGSLRSRPNMDARKWTAAMMVGGAVEIALFVPFGESMGLFNATRIGLHSGAFGQVLLASVALAAIGSLAGSWSWTIASKNIPIGLAGQLIVTETVFATSFGLLALRRWPTWEEATGIACMVVGVVAALRTFRGAVGTDTFSHPGSGDSPGTIRSADFHG